MVLDLTEQIKTSLEKEIENLTFKLKRFESETNPSEIVKRRKNQYQDELIDLQLKYKKENSKFYTIEED